MVVAVFESDRRVRHKMIGFGEKGKEERENPMDDDACLDLDWIGSDSDRYTQNGCWW